MACSDGVACGPPSTAYGVYMNGWAMLHVCYLDLFKACSNGGAGDNSGVAQGVYIDGWRMLHIPYLNLLEASSDGGACDNPGVPPPQAGSHLGSHTAGGSNQLGLIQHHPPEPKLQQWAPVCHSMELTAVRWCNPNKLCWDHNSPRSTQT